MRPAPPIPYGSGCELLLWVFRLRRRARASGSSMLPTLHAGETVLYDPRAYVRRPPRVGEVVVLRHPARPDLLLIKRIHAVIFDPAEARSVGGGRVEVRGDNVAASTDSRDFGPVPRAALLGRVTRRFLPAFAHE